MGESGMVGCFGKLSCVGDFVQRRLPSGFVTPWDAAFEAAVDAARASLGARWGELWPCAPVWRFVLAPGVCGATAWAGVTGPSMDRVGRGFPMVLAVPVSDADLLRQLVRIGGGWFEQLEQLCRAATTVASVDAFDAALLAVPEPSAWIDSLDATADLSTAMAAPLPWRQSGEDRWLAGLFDSCRAAEAACLWWTRGGPRVSPGAFVTRGLPDGRAYVAFLESPAAATSLPQADLAPASSAAGMPADDVLADLLATPVSAAAPIAQMPEPLLDQDALVAGPALAEPSRDATTSHVFAHDAHGVAWVAADEATDDASRQAAAKAARMLEDMPQPLDLSALQAALQNLNRALHAQADDLVNPVHEHATVIALSIDAGHARLLRAGAASAWHWRRGQLRPLFVDIQEVAAPLSGVDDLLSSTDLSDMLSGTSGALPPGLGATGDLRCDQASCLVEPGDRLLLLATTAWAQLPMEQLATALQAGTHNEQCQRLGTAAGQDGDSTTWPLAIIEVGA